MRIFLILFYLSSALWLTVDAQHIDARQLPDSLRQYTRLLFAQNNESEIVRLAVTNGNIDIDKKEVCFTYTNGNNDCFHFDIDSVFNALLQKTPNNYELHKLYADFLFDEFQQERFGKKEDSFDIARRMNDHYKYAWRNGIFDSHSLYAMGYFCSLEKRYSDAAQWYSKALETDSLNPLTNYSMGVSYLLSKNSLAALPYALKATELYTDSASRSDAARMAGIALYENGSFDKALSYFTMADSLAPGYLLNQTFLLRSMLQQNMTEKAVDRANKIFSNDPHNPDIADRLYELFRLSRNNEAYKTHIRMMTKKYGGDHEALGNLKFHYGKLLYLTGQKRRAIKTLKESKKHFLKVLPPNHQVFEALEDMLLKD